MASYSPTAQRGRKCHPGSALKCVVALKSRSLKLRSHELVHRVRDPVPGMTTLQDAADHILRLPKATPQPPHWQAAVEALILAAEGRGPLLHARVGILRAMNHRVERSDGKETHWGSGSWGGTIALPFLTVFGLVVWRLAPPHGGMSLAVGAGPWLLVSVGLWWFRRYFRLHAISREAVSNGFLILSGTRKCFSCLSPWMAGDQL